MSFGRSFDFFIVSDRTNPTWPTGNGGSVTGTAGSAPAGALTRPGTKVVVHTITSLGAGAVDGALDLRKGNGSGGASSYLGGTLILTNTGPYLGAPLDMACNDGLSAFINAGTVGGYLIVFELVR